jgi:hypothetical protein
LKIDRTGIAASSESKALIHALIQLGNTVGLETLGEGIEELEFSCGPRRTTDLLDQALLLGGRVDNGGCDQVSSWSVAFPA